MTEIINNVEVKASNEPFVLWPAGSEHVSLLLPSSFGLLKCFGYRLLLSRRSNSQWIGYHEFCLIQPRFPPTHNEVGG